MVLVGFERRDSVDQMDFVGFAQQHFDIEELTVRRAHSTATACLLGQGVCLACRRTSPQH